MNKESIITKKSLSKTSRSESTNISDIFMQHIRLLTTEFTKYNHPWSGRSPWVGYTALFYLLPIIAIKGNTIKANLFRAAWVIQTILVFSSDYAWSSEEHIIHGLDRWLATLLPIFMSYLAIKYYGLCVGLSLAFLPIFQVFLSKVATANNDWDGYIINQAGWHVTGPIIATWALYDIQLKHNLFG